jgi:hypothetical protein
MYAFLRIWKEARPWWCFAFSGFFAAWTACNELPAASFGLALFVLCLARDWPRTLLFFVPAALVPIAAFLVTNYVAIGEIMPAYEKFGTVWYEFPGSYWSRKRGIDAAADPVWLSAFHLLLGHHGILSLTPVFLLSLAGMLRWKRSAALPAVVPVLALTLSAVVLSFYLVKTNNYGGWTSGPRWFFWLIPLWLLCMIPVADRLAGTSRGRVLGYVLLAFSTLSVGYYAWNPWRHPWIYNLLESQGLIHY